MKQINVIDFDKTLIPFDSFNLYVRLGIKKWNLRFIVYTSLRLLRLISSKTFKKKILKGNPFGEDEMDSFKVYIQKSINQDILIKIKNYSTVGTINVICSASPDFYISEVAKKIGMIGHGSYFISKKEFYHMYGIEKKKFIEKNYPLEQYEYNYSISDSKSDLALLGLFKNKELLH